MFLSEAFLLEAVAPVKKGLMDRPGFSAQLTSNDVFEPGACGH